MSVGYRQNGAQVGNRQPDESDESKRIVKNCRLLFRSFFLSDSAQLRLSVILLLELTQTSDLVGSCGFLSLSFLLSLCVLCSFIFPSLPLFPPVPAALSLYPSTAQPQGTSSMDPLARCQPSLLSLWGGWLFGGFVWALEGGSESL